MNSPTTFQPAQDGWFHIAPLGTFPHPTGALQVIDAEACAAMAPTSANLGLKNVRGKPKACVETRAVFCAFCSEDYVGKHF